ncbi:hypothetical protein LOK49_LG12G02703 [Camellia lanceoleosa]|uniref:Uncharacterized protein n=1 Tax=Camellia lanceoleosa TaxID=1840588 RepID=A0ACC0FXZ7_9ERIC|nr:hypothetical protein LOK49_LG12G02703 [Camellia lanceoleosa]
MSMYSSGLAPFTIKGSSNTVGGLFVVSDGDGGGVDFNGLFERSDLGYISYYYSNVNINPILPSLLLSKYDLRFIERLQGASGSSRLEGIADKRKSGYMGL